MTRRSLRQRLHAVVLTTTAAALLVSAAVLLVYELRSYRSAWIADLTTQADLIAQTSAAALAFDDPGAARESLDLLRLRPQIDAAAVYTNDGRLFASYRVADAGGAALPQAPGRLGFRFDGDTLETFQKVEQRGERVGTVWLQARYDIGGRLLDYLAILVAVTSGSLALAAVIFGGLQRTLTEPILALAQAARDVVRRRDYRTRVAKTTDDEVGELVDSFNDMVRDLGAEMEQRQKAEDALRAADRRKDEFLATLAHELRNPLAPLVTSLEVLRNPVATAETQARARERMGRQLRQLVRLIDDLLDVSRITTGKLALRRERLDLVAVVREALDAVEGLVHERGHAVTTTWPAGPVPVDGDPTRLTQVVVNLLNNAAKYTDAGGRIALSVSVEGARACVRVVDSGVGVDPALQAEIFELFVQVDRSLERERAGLGVGLSLARRLVELHGGTIEVRSAGLGQGSEFVVCLPLAVAVAAPAVPPPPLVFAAAAGGASAALAHPAAPVRAHAPEGADGVRVPLHVLIADDNVDLAASLADMLGAVGHRVRLVHDGRAAVEAALADPPDVALFDIGMPGLNGYDVARRLRAEPATRNLEMVAITGWGQESDRRRAREAGFDRHLVKPVDPEELLALLDEVGNRRAARAAGG